MYAQKSSWKEKRNILQHLNQQVLWLTHGFKRHTFTFKTKELTQLILPFEDASIFINKAATSCSSV